MRTLKSRTSITPNILCRMGFCLSLEESGIPELGSDEDLQGRVINRYTLLGEYDQAFIALLVTWMKKNDIDVADNKNMDGYFMAHMNRGIEILIARLKNLSDLDRLLPRKD